MDNVAMPNFVDIRKRYEQLFPFNEHKAYLIRLGLPLKNNGFVDWKELSKNTERNAIYNNTVKYSLEHQRYIELEWELQLPFDDVFNALSQLMSMIQSNV